MTEPTRTPLEPGFVQRVAQGVRYALSGVTPSGWFSPSQPMQPAAQEQAKGRAWDYQTGYNLQIQPRANEPVGFSQLRGLADGYDLLRLVIETRKDQLERLNWTVQFRDPKRENDGEDARVKDVKAKLLRPDGRLSWRQWMRVVLEDMLVIDAPSVYVRRTNGGKLFALEPIDGATIAPKVDDSGRIPFDGVAYQQIIKGVPACDYMATELVYYPRNLRSFRVYGFSPVEQIITTINIALRRQIAQLQYFTEGNLPETLISVPKEWSVDQIKQFDEHFNSLMQGQAFKRRGYFVPDGTKPYQIKESPLKDEFDDWLARVVCYAFSVSPQALVQMQNRSTAQVGAAEATKEGLEPLKLWMADFVNECILKGWGYDDLEFAWVEEEAIDPLVQAQVSQIYVNARILTPNEVRADLGRDPIEGGDEMAPPVAAPKPGKDGENEAEDDKEAGKAAGLPFGLAKSLPDTEEHDADGAEEASPEHALLTDEDKQKLAVEAALLLLMTRWRVTVWREIGWIIPENVSDDDLAAWAKKYAARTMDFVNATTASKIRKAIEEARAGAQPSTEADIAAKVRDIFNQARDERTGRIADTMSTGAFGFAALDAMKMAGVEESAWITERDGRVRPTHEAMEGQRRPIGMPFTSPSGYMALHPGGFGVAFEDVNCLLPGNRIAGKVERGLKSFYSGKAVELKTASGRSIAITPNHPVLTELGFVPAGRIAKGDNLVCQISEVWTAPVGAIEQDEQNGPTVVEQVFGALKAAFGTLLARVSPVDLHGDAASCDGDVEIVGADLKLGRDPNASGRDAFGESILKHTLLPASGPGTPQLFSDGLLAPDCSGPSGGALPLNGSAVPLDLGPLSQLSFGLPPNFDTSFREAPRECSAANAELVSKTLHALAGQIGVDQVIDVREFDYSGHVYDLQTESSLIVAEGIVVSNCRCHLRPVKMAKADSDVSDDDFWHSREAERAKGAANLAEAIRKIFDAQEAAVLAVFEKD